MNIVFTSSDIKSPSFLFYSESLQLINGLFHDIYMTIRNNPLEIDYSQYDVALFMSFKDASDKAKKDNPSIITAVVEPRAAQKNKFKNVDFIIVNSLEAKDYFSRYNTNLLIYYTYPQVPDKIKCPIDKKTLILGYHGNKIHLDAMYPRITSAMEKLNNKIPLTFWALYNDRFGKWNKPEKKKFGFEVLHIPYSEENYAKFLAHVDIGLVPQFIPVRNSKILRYLIGSFNNKYNERRDNYFFRFKETTNIGRHLVFAQYAVPVISDMTPSSCMFIEDGYHGFLAYHTDGWYYALEKLAFDKVARKSIGKNLSQKYFETVTPEIQNTRLINFIASIKKRKIGSK